MSSNNPFSLVDLGSISEPITKLIETVSNAIGVLYEPKQIVRKAIAEKEAAIIRAEADVEIDKIHSRAEKEKEQQQEDAQGVISLAYKLSASQELQRDVQIESIEVRTQKRISIQEIRRQINTESIINKAVKYLPEKVSDEKVDDDWVRFFFNYAQDISNSDIQNIWAKLLAGEVAKPGSFSYRAINTLRLFNQHEAIVFSTYCRQVTVFYKVVSAKKWKYRKNVFIYEENDISVPEKFIMARLEPIEPSYYVHDAVNNSPETKILESLGLILKVPSSSYFFQSIERNEGILFEYFGKRHLLINNGTSTRVYFSEFTPVGLELASLVDDGQMDKEYLETIIKYFKNLSLRSFDLITLES